MPKSITSEQELFAGLNALVDSAFPKRCANCGRSYQSPEDFLSQTQGLGSDKSGLKQSWDDNEVTIVEVFRNCVCGSTLMDTFSNRRDDSSAGLKRRQKFSDLENYLVAEGMDPVIARSELLKVLRGEGSELLKNYKPPQADDNG